MTPLKPSSRERVDAAVDRLCQKRQGHVCFDADGVLWREDIGNDYLVHAIESGILAPAQEEIARRLWDDYCRGLIRDDFEGTMAAAAVRVLQGLREDFVAADARVFVQSRFHRHLIPAIRRWVGRLLEGGITCWVVSGSPRWGVLAGAALLGIPERNVLAVANVVEAGVLTSELESPLTYGAGKAQAIRRFLPESPILAFGNTSNDIPMLECAEVLAIAVEPDPGLSAAASARGWPVLSTVDLS